MGWGQDRGVEEGEEEEEEKEEKDVEGTFPQLLFLTSLTILSSHFLVFGVWVLPETRGLLDFWDMTSMMFPYSTLSLVFGNTLMRQST